MDEDSVDSDGVTPRSSRGKKKSALSKLAAKRKAKGGSSDESDFGSRTSITNSSRLEPIASNTDKPLPSPRLLRNRLDTIDSVNDDDDRRPNSGRNGRHLEPLDSANDKLQNLQMASDLPPLKSGKPLLDQVSLADEDTDDRQKSDDKTKSNDNQKETEPPVPPIPIPPRAQRRNFLFRSRPNAEEDNDDSGKDSDDNDDEEDEEDDDSNGLNDTKTEVESQYRDLLSSSPHKNPLYEVPFRDQTPPSQSPLPSPRRHMDTSYGGTPRPSRLDKLMGSSGNMSDTAFSDRTFSTMSSIPQISTRQARERSFLVGSTSLIGSEELEKCFPDRKLRIFVISWNMMGAQPKDLPKSLDDLLLPENIEFLPDICVVATQESCPDRKEWEIRIQETIGPTHVMVHTAQHGTLHICVFVKREMVWYCSVPEDAYLTTRKALRTKGCVAISLVIFGTSFLFMSSHFKPDDGRLKERIEDYTKTIKELDLPKKVVVNEYQNKSTDVTSRFDCVFWAGDLNFRIDRPRHVVDAVMKAIVEKDHPNFEDLLVGDELYKAKMEGTAFSEFQEGRINFAPTYKFDIGTGTYDTSTRLRIPSYCDRVLFRSKRKHGIVCLHYNSIDVTSSDHRPVYGLYEVDIRPGRDNVPLAGGQFNRDIYLEANRRRARHLDTTSKLKDEKSSSICSIS